MILPRRSIDLEGHPASWQVLMSTAANTSCLGQSLLVGLFIDHVILIINNFKNIVGF